MSTYDRSDITVLTELDLPEASRNAFLAVLGLGVAFDFSINGQNPGVSISLFFLILAASLRTVCRRSIETDVLLAGAVLIAIFPTLHGTDPLAAFDLLAAAGLLVLAVTQDLGSMLSISIVGLLRRAGALFSRTLTVPRYLTAPFAGMREGNRAFAVLRWFLVVVPVLAIFAALLASGDQIFGRILSSVLPEWNAANLVTHVVLTIVGTALVAILWRSAVGDGADPVEETERTPPTLLGRAEWMTVLAGIDVLFGIFVLVQLRYLFGGNSRVLVTPGLTYAEYARSGFLQMSLAAALTILVILAVWDTGVRTSREHDRWFRILVTVMVGLTSVVLASALKRLALYEGTFGFTRDRFFGYIAIASIGAVLVLLIWTIWMERRDRVVVGFLLIGFVALLTVNVMSPDRFVADRNVARYRATGKIDAAYLGSGLGSDAVPAVVAILPDLQPADATILREGLCRHLEDLEPEPSWRSANLGRSFARDALRSAGITPATCDRVVFG